MAALTAAQVKPAGAQEVLTCELCFEQFEFTHNGEWVPACCPLCKGLAGQRYAGFGLSQAEIDLLEEIFDLLGETNHKQKPGSAKGPGAH